MTFRVGIIGSGNISETHARAAAETDGVELVACWGRNPVASARLAQTFGATSFASLDALVSHRPLDAVLVGTPSGVHAEHALAAVRQGLHALVEKPLDITLAKVDALLAESAQRGTTIGVFFQDRTAPDLVWLKHLIESGGLGTLVIASTSVRWYRPPEYYAGSKWRGTKALDGGGALMNQGTHSVDLLLWLFGDVARVSSFARTALHRIEVEDTLVASLEFRNGAVGTFEVTTAAYPGFPRRMAFTGTEGSVVVEGDRVTEVALRTTPATPPPQRAGNTSASSSSPVVADVEGHKRVLRDFVAAVRDGGAPLCDGREGRRSVALAVAMYESARTGNVVEL